MKTIIAAALLCLLVFAGEAGAAICFGSLNDVHLNWTRNPEDAQTNPDGDVSEYELWRGSGVLDPLANADSNGDQEALQAAMDAAGMELVAVTDGGAETTAQYVDSPPEGVWYYYLRAVDWCGNSSMFSIPSTDVRKDVTPPSQAASPDIRIP